MPSFDYVALEPEGKNVLSGFMHPIRAAAGLVGVALVGAATYIAKASNFSKSENEANGPPASKEFLPKQGIDAVLTKPLPPGPLQAMHPMYDHCKCLFVYGPLWTETQRLVAEGSSGPAMDGWMYGAKLTLGPVALATGEPGDVLKGKLLCWSEELMPGKLRVADKLWGFSDNFEHHSLAGRSIATIVKQDGNTAEAYWYFQAKPVNAADNTNFAQLSSVIDIGEKERSLMDSVRGRRATVRHEPVTIVVVGASGDLAKKKTFPALFSLFYHDLLPKHFQIYGFARKNMSKVDFQNLIMGSLTCRVIDGARCSRKMEEFIPHCMYFQGQYDSHESFEGLAREISHFEKIYPVANRMFYLAIPPSVFEAACSSISHACRARRGSWTRVVVEKPFGRDLASYEKLQASLSKLLKEEEIYRIDHYLGKELVQNLMTLRFANSVFEPLWNRQYIESVQIIFKEPFGVEGRAGYFNDIGIIRDIMQNHLLQVLALIGMEVPVSLQGEDIRNEKVKLLRNIKPLEVHDFVLGQYKGKGKTPGYLDDEGVPHRSTTPTFAACAFQIHNRRWEGVPFLMKAGKALDERKAEIRIIFKATPGDIFSVPAAITGNELVLRVQPEEAIYLKIVSKAPGLTSHLEQARLNLFYRTAWEESKDIPDAYERLILDVIQGEKSLFIRHDELEVAWKIFDGALHEMETEFGPKPELYEYGSRGPIEAERLAYKLGVKWIEDLE
eukprot:gb/GEZN01002150.1/.p1 GENE.gb/GEZN01002150.1/~~gb/GEZN01002150.1/.p1  ORF type:complete len:727 (-),score=95.59 gb/GEZN01002150.1/:401-2581(-)